MAHTILDARIWFSKYHLSADHNRVTVDVGFDQQDATVFTDTARRIDGTLPKVEVTGGGFITWGTGYVHDVLRSNINVANVPVSIAGNGGTDGTYAETFLAKTLNYKALGEVGKLTPFSWKAMGEGVPSINGTIIGVGAKSSTANGTARQLGAVAAGKRLYVALHVMTVTGSSPTLDLVIASDDNSGFSSGTSRITFGQKTAAGHDWQSVAGAITDDYWRAQWTIGGTGSPSFDVAIVAGIF